MVDTATVMTSTLGDGVNVAARLEALEEPGGICISATVRDHVGTARCFEVLVAEVVKRQIRTVAPARVFRVRATDTAIDYGLSNRLRLFVCLW